MLVGLINPAAGRDAAVDLAHVLASASPRLRLFLSDRPEDTTALVETLRAAGTELLVLAGGDGTLQNLLTRFDEAGALDLVPPILVLPVGRVNTVASALVGSRRPAQLAQRILHAWTRGVRRLQRMPVLRLAVEGQPDRVGVTCSLGATARLHADYRQGLTQGGAGIAETMSRLALLRLPAARFAPIVGPFDLQPGPMKIPVVTAGVLSPLPGFFGFVRPFPGVRSIAATGFHTALSAFGPLASQTAMLGILRGYLQDSPHMQYGEHTYFSWRNGDAPDLMVLDGEEMNVAPGAKVTVSVAAHVRMLVWRDMPAASTSA